MGLHSKKGTGEASRGKADISHARTYSSRLEQLGFCWDLVESKWDNNRALLYHFKEKHGHWRDPRNYHLEDVNLGAWLARQRCLFSKLQAGKPTAMTADRIKKFDAIGFSFCQNHEHSGKNPNNEFSRQLLRKLCLG